jgi:hypothetical protein
MTKRTLLLVAIAAAALLICFLLIGPVPDERTLTKEFYFRNAANLQSLVSVARGLPRDTRIEADEMDLPDGCSTDPNCRSAASATQALLKKMRTHVVTVNEQCSRGSRCSISITFRRKGISVSGSGTELIYDTAPDWGYFKIYPVPGAPEHWYYRHLGD